MNYKVGDTVPVTVELLDGRKRLLVARSPSKNSQLSVQQFQIVSIDTVMETYKIILDDDIVGWTITEFHIEYQKVPKVFKGKKFYDISEIHILPQKK